MKLFQLPTVSKREWFVVRCIFAIFLVLVPDVRGLSHQPVPVGWANWFDFTCLGIPSVFFAVILLRVVAIWFYLTGHYRTVSTGFLIVTGAALNSLNDSQGAIYYAAQVIYLILLGQFIAFLYSDIRSKTNNLDENELEVKTRSLAFRNSQVMFLSFYLISAITKLQTAGLNWVMDAPLMGLQVIKAYHMRYFESLDSSFFDRGLDLADVFFDNPELVQILLGLGLALELFGLLALATRRLTFIAGICFIIFHESMNYVLQINLYLFELFVLLYLIRLSFLDKFGKDAPSVKSEAKIESG